MALRLSLSASLAFAAGLSLASAAQAAQGNCDTYGRLALQQQKENESLKCGFSGPEWSGDLKAHIAWCGRVGADQWKAQLTARTQRLAACKAGR